MKYTGLFVPDLVCVRSYEELTKALEERPCSLLILCLNEQSSAIDVLDVLVSFTKKSTRGRLLILEAPYGEEASTMRVLFGGWLTVLPLPFCQKSFQEVLDRTTKELDRQSAAPLSLRVQNRVRAVRPDAITFIESNRRVLHIHLEHEVIRTYAKLSDILMRLPATFIQCHKSFLVNMDYIDELGATYASIKTGDVVPVSQKRRKSTKEAYDVYISERGM